MGMLVVFYSSLEFSVFSKYAYNQKKFHNLKMHTLEYFVLI